MTIADRLAEHMAKGVRITACGASGDYTASAVVAMIDDTLSAASDGHPMLQEMVMACLGAAAGVMSARADSLREDTEAMDSISRCQAGLMEAQLRMLAVFKAILERISP